MPSDDRMARSAPVSPRLRHRPSPFEGNGSITPRLRTGLLTDGGPPNSRAFHPNASIVLVGVRGSGKRSLGLIAAAALGRRFVTEDHFFQSTTGLSRQEYLKLHGSEEFHKQDVEVTRRMLEDNKMHCVIDCGLGSLTSSLQEHLKRYCITNPVIYLIRDMEQIKSLLKLGDRSAKLLEAGDPSHRKCSNFEFYNLQDDAAATTVGDALSDRASPNYSFKLRQAQEDFSRFVRFITTGSADPSQLSDFALKTDLSTRAYTHVLEVPLSKFDQSLDLTMLQATADVVEIVVDKWHPSLAKTLTKLIASMRRYIGTPLIVSTRLAGASVESRLAILGHALRLGVDLLSVDLELDPDRLPNICAVRGRTRIIGTVARANPSLAGWRDPTLLEQVKKARQLKCDYVRIVMPANSRDDMSGLNWFHEEALRTGLLASMPMIAFNSGELGRLSQVLNPVLTSVTHPSLHGTSQANSDSLSPIMTSAQIVQALGSCYMLDALQFCIVGGDVSESLSPPIHNAAYEALGLYHSYTTRNIRSWDEVETLAKNVHFGGASVVQPWKVKAVAKLSSLSVAAKAIGAVNTLLPLRTDSKSTLMSLSQQAYHRNRSGPIAAWHGDNTDFVGIKVCLARSLTPRNVIHPKTTGLVIGAGGMARAAIYAMIQLGCRNIFIHNRTVSNARTVARHFNDWAGEFGLDRSMPMGDLVQVLESVNDKWPSSLSMPTMVVSCVTHERLDDNPGAEFEMPLQWLESQSGGVIVEMAYMIKQTALTEQIRRFRSETGRPWITVSGVDTLIEQAVAQFEIFTGRIAPRRVMLQAVKSAMETNRHYMMDWGGYQETGILSSGSRGEA
jgi:shikimate 5-dehydrogenase/shikimate kinase/3-dehydroquinate dehydratase